ncbi:hypothetical protein Leryth_003336 [Lithospermum erythrorhizon]|uniref:Peroxin-13 n=1 Tax=Lithospermum erythrorhizon TaxID=34254 RepID=A0AAV3RDX7_LITER|nr:hypothetical protein Leryth_003336 [Lithospermum erythrorhizon]
MWQMYGVSRFAILIHQNTQAFHMFMMALLQMARFVPRLLGFKRKPKQVHPPGLQNPHSGQNYIEGPKAAPSGPWDNVWGHSSSIFSTDLFSVTVLQIELCELN